MPTILYVSYVTWLNSTDHMTYTYKDILRVNKMCWIRHVNTCKIQKKYLKIEKNQEKSENFRKIKIKISLTSTPLSSPKSRLSTHNSNSEFQSCTCPTHTCLICLSCMLVPCMKCRNIAESRTRIFDDTLCEHTDTSRAKHIYPCTCLPLWANVSNKSSNSLVKLFKFKRS